MRFTEIGQQLRAYRLESGLRAEEIAARLGVSRAALYRYEKGEVIKLDTIKRLAELLKISPLSLLGIEGSYYSRPVGYERLRQIEETADQVLYSHGPGLATSPPDAYDVALSEASRNPADQAGPERAAMRSMSEQVLGILKAQADALGQAGLASSTAVLIGAIQRLLTDGVAGSIPLSDRVRRLCRQVAEFEVENIAALMETEPMGLQFGVLVGAEPTSAFKILRLRDRPPGSEPVPAGRASERTHRGCDDHRRRRSDHRAPARCRDELARGAGDLRRREAAPIDRTEHACLKRGADWPPGCRGNRASAGCQ